METTTCEEKHLEKLDLDAPLMSTRRLCSHTSATSNSIQTKEISRRVPFLWERTAGVPFVNSKEEEVEDDDEEEEEILPPKPPPGRHRSLSAEEIIKVEDDTSEYDEDEVFLDALENLSISESMSSFRRSPSFIMDRFLPAANAIAASSSTFQQAPKKMKRRRAPYSHPHEQRSPEWLKKPRLKQQQCTHASTNSKLELQQCVPRSQSPSKACGLMLFFPWSLKNNLCGFKSATPPVRCRSPMSVSVSVRGSLRCSNDQMVRWKNDGDDKMSSKACQSPGWGLPFLNSSNKVSKRTRFADDEMKERGRSLMFNPPQLKPPTDSWLQHALTKKLK
ncbi:hypothetical protein IHE45_18G093700 [Dioscorea alata]|uniref:Uncharacterized protein n=1 Tax=Dioscorea alata TaxID=55571 RepID=A0ACB7U908_DIOAL|nr:hypothetical protein IHE45_18G093700 [Dioscorea alata]